MRAELDVHGMPDTLPPLKYPSTSVTGGTREGGGRRGEGEQELDLEGFSSPALFGVEASRVVEEVVVSMNATAMLWQRGRLGEVLQDLAHGETH